MALGQEAHKEHSLRPDTATASLLIAQGPSEMGTLGGRLELVRDAAVTRRERTQHGPTDDRLGQTAGG
jgi:hypothetical protein